MELTIKNSEKEIKPINKSSYIDDIIIQNFYKNYYNNLTSRELDNEFNKDFQTLIRSIKKISDSERKTFISILSSVMEFYLEKKVEKEIDESFLKLLDL